MVFCNVNSVTPYGVLSRVCTTPLQRSVDYTNYKTKFGWQYPFGHPPTPHSGPEWGVRRK